MSWLSNWFGPKVSEDKTYITEAMRDTEDPMLNEAEAKDAVASFKRSGLKMPFWNFLRSYKAKLRRETVQPAGCCGGVCDDGGVAETVAGGIENIAIAAINAASARSSQPVDDTPVSQPAYEPPSSQSSWNSNDNSPPSSSSSWSSDSGSTSSSSDSSSSSSSYDSGSSSSSYDSGSSSSCDSGSSSSGGDF